MQAHFNEILEKAIKAPSGHNTQPWKFKTDGNVISIFPDYERALQVVDADNHALFISLGCALENIIIAAEHFNYETVIKMDLKNGNREQITITLTPSSFKSNDHLFGNIDIRQSTRNEYNSLLIPQADIEKLQVASLQEDVNCMIFTDNKKIVPIAELVKEAAAMQFKNKAFMNELTHWVRFNKKAGKQTGDGLYGGAIGKPSVPKWLGKFFMNITASPEGEAKKQADLIFSSYALILFIAKRNDKQAWVNVGRSFERVALTATSVNINHAHENMPCEEITVRKKLIERLNLINDEQPLLLIRIGYSKKMPYSFRRPIEDVLINN